MSHATAWDEVLTHMRVGLDAEEFRRWFGDTSYASDVGDQITVWVPSEAIRRHLTTHFDNEIHQALAAMGRAGTLVRFVVAGYEDDEEEEEEEEKR
jgi:chromosomal replication initiation ATPase DnaA